MTTNKDFKRIVRGRMAKTGESYTAARAQMLKDGKDGKDGPAHFATLAGMSDAKVKAATGCTWEKWVQALDYKKAHTWSHGEIAEYVHTKFKVPSWWTQMVTVGYERIKGLREKGQRRDGGYAVSKTKVFHAPRTRLYRAFNDKRARNGWLPGVDLTIRTKIRDKSMRITMPDHSSVHVWFIGKGTGKSQLAIEHVKLVDKEAAERTRTFWGERLQVLAQSLKD